MFQRRYCVHAQFKVKLSNARVRSVAGDVLENYFYEKLLCSENARLAKFMQLFLLS